MLRPIGKFKKKKKKDTGADLEVLPNLTIWVFTRVTVTDGNTLKNQIQEVDSDIKSMDLKQKEEGDGGSSSLQKNAS